MARSGICSAGRTFTRDPSASTATTTTAKYDANATGFAINLRDGSQQSV
jgi:hypothetical protein